MLKRVLGFLYATAALLLLTVLNTGCSTSKKTFNPNRSFTKGQLQRDYTLFRNILQESHPSLYWYTPRDSMDYFFDRGYQSIRDSMTEPQFRLLLSYVIAKIDCGHTSVKYSKQYARYLDTVRLPQFPLGIKFWEDSAVVYFNVNRKDSVLRRGTILERINNIPFTTIRDSLFRYMVMDGHSINHKYQSLSNLGSFGNLYQNVFGRQASYTVDYIDSSGREKATSLKLYDLQTDSSFRKFMAAAKRPDRKERNRNNLFATRNLQVDTAGGTAYMMVSTFSDGNKLRSFFRNSFRVLRQKRIKNLVIDVRTNGGGNVGLSTKLTKYIANKKFKLADSLYAIRRLSRYESHIQHSLPAFFFMNVVTRKRSDGFYHFGYFERHYFRPVKKNHYNGNVYILTGGNSFSATAIFVSMLKGQQNVKIVGEETGGGAYGNTAWFIPDVTLPHTRIRFRLPKFHMVIDKDRPKDGRGILPDIPVEPTTEAIRKGYDVKLEAVRKLIEGTRE
jgi:hypothetical protein